MASELLVNKITPESGTTLTLGETGDTISFASGVLPSLESLTITGDLTVDTNTLFVDSTNNRVGIGTASPTYDLQIEKDGGGSSVRLDVVNTGVATNDDTLLSFVSGSNNNENIIFFGDTDDSNVGQIRYDHATDSMEFFTNASERMRIDSSGNLLVGKTSINYLTDGFQSQGSGGDTGVTGNGISPFFLNRRSSDGNIMLFFKDGTTVGSIGTYLGDLYIGEVGTSNDCFLKFGAGGGTLIAPATSSGADQDDGISLGRSTARFKNAYLSGNIYLGGTGSANALDDYEEGTWTAIYTTTGTDFTSVTYDFRNAYYTKIGRQVTCSLSMRTDAITKGSASGTVALGGLPFQADKDAYEAVAIGSQFAVNNPSGIRVINNTTTAYLQKGYNNGSLVVSDMGTGTNDNFMALVFTYFTD